MRQQEGREVVIVEAVRTPIGRGHKEKGYYKDTHRTRCSAKTYTEVIERAGVDASEVEDVIAGCVQQFGEQGFNIGRNAWLQAGLPIETPGDHDRPPVRLRPAGGQLLRRADRGGRPRRR
jgi:acetyl-CoA acyltransferase